MKKYFAIGIISALAVLPTFAAAQATPTANNSALIATLEQLVQLLTQEIQQILAQQQQQTQIQQQLLNTQDSQSQEIQQIAQNTTPAASTPVSTVAPQTPSTPPACVPNPTLDNLDVQANNVASAQAGSLFFTLGYSNGCPIDAQAQYSIGFQDQAGTRIPAGSSGAVMPRAAGSFPHVDEQAVINESSMPVGSTNHPGQVDDPMQVYADITFGSFSTTTLLGTLSIPLQPDTNGATSSIQGSWVPAPGIGD